jgi:ABC-type nitrate/sulfonate/bicarbonate transport system substrate-binding protein
MNQRNRFILIAVIIVLLLAVIGSLYIRQKQLAANNTGGTSTVDCHGKYTTMKLALDWTPNTNHTGIYVAYAKGWYKDQCINLTIVPYSANVSADTMVANGQAQVGISSTESIVADAAVGQPVVSIAAIVQHNTSGLVVLKSSDITSPKGLDGKIYGGFGTTYESAVVSAIIKKAGGTGNFQNVTLDIDTMNALETKKIDFAWVYDGWEVIQAQHDGYPVNFFPITSYGIPDYYTPNFITSPSEIKSNPALLKGFMAATSRGYTYAIAHEHEAASLLISSTTKGTFPDETLVYDSQKFLSAHYVDSGHTWGKQDASSWTGYPEFMLNAGAILDSNNKPVTSLNFSSLYSNQFLP